MSEITEAKQALQGVLAQLRKQAFQPASEERRQVSTYTNGHNFDSQWRIYCRSQAPDTTTYLTTAAQSTSGFGANPTNGMYLSAL